MEFFVFLISLRLLGLFFLFFFLSCEKAIRGWKDEMNMHLKSCIPPFRSSSLSSGIEGSQGLD